MLPHVLRSMNVTMCIVDVCDSHCGNQHSVNRGSKEIALFGHQRFQSAQPGVKIYRVHTGHMTAFFCGEPVPLA